MTAALPFCITYRGGTGGASADSCYMCKGNLLLDMEVSFAHMTICDMEIGS